jgi:hypothetical protein
MSFARTMTALRAMTCAVAVGATMALTAGCGGVEMDADYPDGAYGAYGDYPPDSYIATTDPVYFEGHAAYWYGNRWYYRDGDRWSHYDREPAGLYQRRMQGGARRRVYEGGGHGGSRGGGRSGGGGHGGHR